ncbi:MAG: RdgB/HAM1 family non-canonical purine NTP pyrophosphatase [Clostridiales bacterium]|nr:RdgB/HAM1 family non-canonical purine NTP pyrophosphatase [Clostridiales bacterium]
MKFVLASHNPRKLEELQTILQQLGVEIVLQSQLGIDLEPEETGTTFEENALIKARAVMEASGLPAIADDSGLCSEALNGGPGVYSARYGGPDLNDQQRYQLLLQSMRGQLSRKASFVSVVACAFPNGDVISARGECEGRIGFTPVGEDGFGYDPIFLVPECKKTFAQMTPEEKNAVSHRGKALRAFAGELETYLNGRQAR